MRRRSFLIGSAALAGGLVVGYRAWSASFARAAAEQVEGPGEHLLAGWVKIGADDRVTVQIPHVDMGQGIHTALAMMLAEELDADWSMVATERAPGEKTFANRFLARGWVLQGVDVPAFADGVTDAMFAEAARFIGLQITGGSTAVRFTGRIGMRTVGAAARAMLVEAAAQRWRAPAARLTVRDGIVSDPASGRAAPFGELAEAAADLAVPAHPRLKRPSEWRLVGTSPPRHDIPAKSDGTFRYGIDLQLDGLVHAALRAAPVHGGRLVDVDPQPALARPGILAVVPLERAVAVVAESWWQAERAAGLLEPVFSDGGNGAVSQREIERRQDAALASSDGEAVVAEGDAGAAFAAAPPEHIVTATYRVPFLHHAAMEPINVTARFADGVLAFWGGEQDALGCKLRIVELAGLGAGEVVVNGLPAGGSFGRRTAQSADYLEHIVPLAMQLAPRPVKLILSREQDFAQGAYRPALATRIEAALGPDGLPLAWRQSFLDAPTRNEAFRLPYAIPAQSIRAIDIVSHVRTGTWRSVAHTQHVFWTECFIDELAHAAGRDPLEYRLALLAPGSRAARALTAAAELADWSGPVEAGTGRGIAFAESYGTMVAMVVEAALDRVGEVSVGRVAAVVDCGGLVHPDTARQQVEGSVVMGLGAALREQITLENGAVAQRNFPDYPVLTLAETPVIQIRFLAGDGPWGGLGEPALPPVAPALANAVFAATGRRVRRLPIVEG